MSDDPFLRFLLTRDPVKVSREWTSARLVDVVREAEPPVARVPESVRWLERKLADASELLTEAQQVQWRREAERLGGAYMVQRGRLQAAERKVVELREILAARDGRKRVA